MQVVKSILLISNFCLGFLFLNAQNNAVQSISLLYDSQLSLNGRLAFLGTPFYTAGDKLYMVVHQDGSFPDLGWHVKEEMGGIWHHPIKLMDGFNTSLLIAQKSLIRVNTNCNFILNLRLFLS